ncbi:mandelate racemase, partial [Nocardia gipuzkoensis]
MPRIVAIHEGTVPISSAMSNAFIDFSAMDCSIVAVVSDVVRDGEPVVGYGFNSNGPYSAGEMLR